MRLCLLALILLAGALIMPAKVEADAAAAQQETVCDRADVLFCENFIQSRTTACYAAGNCPAKFKSAAPICCPLQFGTVDAATGNGAFIGTGGVLSPPDTNILSSFFPVGTTFPCTAPAQCNPVGQGNGFQDMVTQDTNNLTNGGTLPLGSRTTLYFRYYYMEGTDFSTSQPLGDLKIWEVHNVPATSSQLFLGHFHNGATAWYVPEDEVAQVGGGGPYFQNVGTPISRVRGVWNCLEFRVTVNTESPAGAPGVPGIRASLGNNGYLQGWIDDVQKWEYPNTNIFFFHGGSQNIGFFRITNSGINGVGGSTIQGHRYVDRIVIATSRIGCASGSLSTPPNAPTNLKGCIGPPCTPIALDNWLRRLWAWLVPAWA